MRALIACARASAYGAILSAAAATPVLGSSGARTLERSDWLAHLPLALAVVSFVVVVDAVVFTRIVRALRRAGR